MTKKFKLKYTELLGDDERKSEMIIETNDINFTLEQFTRNRHVIEMESREIKETNL